MAALLTAASFYGAPRAGWSRDARELLAHAQARNGLATWTTRRSVVTLRSFDEGGRRTREAVVWEKTDPMGAHRTLIDFTGPDDVRGTRLLHVSPRGEPDQYWIWQPHSRRVRRLGGHAGGSSHRDEIMTGNDMSYRDLELVVRILQWDANEASATLDEDEACGETTCHRVVLVPTRPNEFPCRRYRLWYSRDDLLLRRVELYDLDDRLVKTVAFADYVPTGARTTARSCTIEHVPSKTSSTITVHEVAFDVDVADELFSVARLGER